MPALSHGEMGMYSITSRFLSTALTGLSVKNDEILLYESTFASSANCTVALPCSFSR